jgi:hypothetical protein
VNSTKVAAFNNGGWSDFSEETNIVRPGEDQAPVSRGLKWKRTMIGLIFVYENHVCRVHLDVIVNDATVYRPCCHLSSLLLESLHFYHVNTNSGGPLAILDRLNEFSDLREEQIAGMSKLLALAPNTRGFSKGKIAFNVAVTTLNAIRKFPNDFEISSLVFYLLGKYFSFEL